MATLPGGKFSVAFLQGLLRFLHMQMQNVNVHEERQQITIPHALDFVSLFSFYNGTSYLFGVKHLESIVLVYFIHYIPCTSWSLILLIF